MDLNIDFEKEKVQEEKKLEEIIFKQENCTFDLPLRIDQFSSDKELIRYIKNVENLVRDNAPVCKREGILALVSQENNNIGIGGNVVVC